MIRWREIWDRLNTGYWFVPSAMAIASLAVAYGTVSLDEMKPAGPRARMAWGYGGGPEGAAGVLSAIAGSMINLAGLVFSLTLVVLSLTSSQFGPRLLRNFLRDRVTQVVMGTFLSAFLYSLFVLRTVRRGDGSEFVPHVSVTVAVVFAVAALVALIFFVHHLATSIQADSLVARVADDFSTAVDRLYPDDLGDPAPPEPSLPDGPFANVASSGDGYVQAVEAEKLLETACGADVVIELLVRPGHYVLAGAPVARVWPADRVDDELAGAINGALARGSARTPHQDIEFVINQLVEIALRALSPGINDPFTAIVCIDRLGSGLARLAQRAAPAAHRLGPDGRLRLVARPVRFPNALDAAFNQIRQFGRTSAAITIRLLDVLADLSAVVSAPGDRAALRRHAEMLARAREALPEENDRRDVEARAAALTALAP